MHPTSVVHALVRFRDGAALAHVGYPDMRVPISYALTYPDRADDAVPPLDFSAGLILEFFAARPRDVPLPRARAGGGGGGRNRAVRPERGERGRGRVVPRPARSRSSGSPRSSSARSRRSRRRPRATLDDLLAADAEASRAAGSLAARSSIDLRRRHRRARVPDPHPRGRALLRRAPRADAAAEVLHLLPACARQVDARRNRVRHRRDPAGRLREDPRDAPARRAGPRGAPGPRGEGGTRSSSRGVAAAALALEEERFADAQAELAELRTASSTPSSPSAPSSAPSEGLTDVEDGLADDAYWRAPVSKRIAVIAAGPLTNLALRDRAPRRRVHARRLDGATSAVDAVTKDTPAESAGLLAGDVVVRVTASRSPPDSLSDAIQAGKGAPVTLDGRARRRAGHAPGDAARGGSAAATSSASCARSRTAATARSRRPGRRSQETWHVTSLTGAALGHGSSPGRAATRCRAPSGSSRARATRSSSTTGLPGHPRADQPLARAPQPAAVPAARRGAHRVHARRGRSAAAPSRASPTSAPRSIGIALVLMLFFLGLSNDVNRLSGG